VSRDHQHAYFGSLSTRLSDDDIEAILKARNFSYTKCHDLVDAASKALLSQQIIGWWQGRSECGPRALGNRSILAFPDRAGLKNYLNHSIKGRESFRPYGCSVLQDKAHLYFEVNQEFENPFMSFAVKVKSDFRDQLAEVTHVDQTSRMQTVRRNQNKLFYELIKKVGDQSGLYCLLNTSLNVMGEPIVETLDDALYFFEHTPVDTMFVGPFQLLRKDQA
jgi:carbamoyltransferase